MVTSWAAFILLFSVFIVLLLSVVALYLDQQIVSRALLLQMQWCGVRTRYLCSLGSEVYPLAATV